MVECSLLYFMCQGELEKQLQKHQPEFVLPFKTEVDGKEMTATLHFKRSDSSGMYFFNKYDMRMQGENACQKR